MGNQTQVQTQVRPQQRNTAAQTANSFTRQVSGTLSRILEKKQAALPKSLNRERFEMNCVQMIQDAMKDYKTQQKWLQCDPTTVAMTLAKAAFLDLDFFNGEAYAIPYGRDVQFQTDYKGEIKLIKKYSRNAIRDVYAKIVREGDQFEVSVVDGVQHLVYKPEPFSKNEIIGVFAVIYYRDGSMIFDTMGIDEIEHIRNTYSKAKDSPAWRNSYGEMAKKTVLRRICKLVDLDFNIDQWRSFQDGGDSSFENDTPPMIETKKEDIFANDKDMQARIAQAGQKKIDQKPENTPQEKTAEKQPEPVKPEPEIQEEYPQDYAEYEEFQQQNIDDFANMEGLPFK